MVHAEWLLLLGVLGFYLWDGSALLFSDEFLLIERQGAWSVGFDTGVRIRGRYLWLPAPWLWNRSVFRVRIQPDEQPRAEHVAGVMHFSRALGSLQRYAAAMAALLFGALPFVVLYKPHPYVALGLIAVIYATSGLMVVQVFRYRRVYELTLKDVFSLSLDAVACPPFALNTAGKICRKRGIRGDAYRFARGVLAASELVNLNHHLAERLREVVDLADDSSPIQNAALACMQRLPETQPWPQPK